MQAQKEALLASALNDSEKGQLNGLLRRLMLQFEIEAPDRSTAR